VKTLPDKQNTSFALTIDAYGIITSIIAPSSVIGFHTGDNLIRHIDEGSIERFLDYLQETLTNNHVLSREIVFKSNDNVFERTISMIRHNNTIICVSLHDNNKVFGILNTIMRINSEQSKLLRRQVSGTTTSGYSVPESYLDEVSALNSELVNIQRKLEQKNAELIRLNMKLKDIGNKDPLTMTNNRRKFFEDITGYLKEKDHHLIMIDFNNFKKVNDEFGHGQGDLTLKTFTNMTTAEIKPLSGTLYRIGGDEFAILIPADKPIDMEEITKKVDRYLKTVHPELSLAYGIQTIAKDRHMSKRKAENLLVSVDKAMYNHKNTTKKNK